jgi:hypothetical protein
MSALKVASEIPGEDFIYLFIFWVLLGLQLRALHLLGRCTWTMPSALSWFSYDSGKVFHFCLGQPCLAILLLQLPASCGYRYELLSLACWLRWGLGNLLPGQPQIMKLLISASQIAGITGVYQHSQPQIWFFILVFS